jgi:hypothetical protein
VRPKGSAAGLAVDLHIATGALNQAVDQKQPYPCAFSHFGMKMSKQVKQLLAPPNQVDAQAIVSHLKQGGCALGAHVHPQRAGRLAVLEGIAEQIK